MALPLFSFLVQAFGATADGYRLYFGSIAKEGRGGIYMASLDMKTGQLGKAAAVAPTAGSGFLVIHPDGKRLYSTLADRDFNGTKSGAVQAYRITGPDGLLAEANTESSGGSLACHVSLDPLGKNLLVANYLGGSCTVLPIKPDGSLAPASSVQKHTGSSIHPKRQTAAFTHSVNCDPAGRFALVADLGMDKIMTYRFDAALGTLVPGEPPFTATEAGGGPRHLTFHPSGKFVYAGLELTNKVVAYAYDAATGTLHEIQSINTLPDGFAAESTTSEVLTTPDGRFLYVANRGHNSLSIFAIDPATGKLSLVGHEPTRGDIPRNFHIDPTGTYLVVVNAKPGNAVVFRIHPEDGRLAFTGSEVEIPNPGCVRGLFPPK